MNRGIKTITVVLTLVGLGSVITTQGLMAGESYYDLGGFHREASTESESAQVWFDRGLAMCYGFNHEEAVRCFEKALEADSSMAMAYWGMAYALGPNINYLDVPAHQISQGAMCLRLAEIQCHAGSPLERDLISALAKRYVVPVLEDRHTLNVAYSQAMREVYQQNREDPMVAALYAESLMNLRPWKHWTPEGEPAEETPEILSVLEAALGKHPDYPALCHLYIHAIEASPNPGKGLPAADALRNAMPEAGHLLHMPSHIDVLVGDYESVITANQRAIEADKLFLEREGAHNFYSLYRIHNYHFLVYGAMFDGQRELALNTARKIPEQVPEEMIIELVDFLDAFMPTSLHVMVRFGMWEEILQEPEPADYLPAARSIWRYARGLALASLDRVPEAEEEYTDFVRMSTLVPETSILFNNSTRDILKVAHKMLQGEIAYRKGELEKAFTYLREAVVLDDSLNYDEPWGWMQPARHALGALLLEQGNLPEAEAVYTADLRRHPDNVWALHGLAESMDRQGKTAEAEKVRSRFSTAVVRADVTVDRSCFCRIDDIETP